MQASKEDWSSSQFMFYCTFCLIGRIPLHFSALKGTSADIVEALLKVYPNSADCANFFGSTPKMMASKNVSTAKESIMEALEISESRMKHCVRLL